MTSSVEESQLSLLKNIIDFNLKGAEGKAIARAAMIADMPKVKELFASRNRPALQAELKEMFEEQKEKYGVDQAQFHLPSVVSFLRLHTPEKFDDDLTKFRPIVVAVNRELVSKKGFEIARSGPAVFGAVPVYDVNRKHIGSFEVGIAFNPLLVGLKEAYNLELALFVKEAPLKEFAKGVSPGIYSDQNRLGEYIRFHSTNSDLIKALIVDSDLNNLSGSKFTRSALGTPYGIVTVPLRNAIGDVQGIIVVAKNFSSSRSAEGKALVWQILMALFAIVLLTGFILIVIRGILLHPLKILTKKFEHLANGEKSSEVFVPGLLCEELEDLAHQHERLSAKQETK
jgi:hypothetical protein